MAKENNKLQELYMYKNYSFNANLLIRDNWITAKNRFSCPNVTADEQLFQH